MSFQEDKEIYYNCRERFNPDVRRYVDGLEKENEVMNNALMKIASDKEIHTRINQVRLCCKFQDIAIKAVESINK